MTKNIAIIVLTLLMTFFGISSFLLKQKNKSLDYTIDTLLPEMLDIAGENNDEYYKNMHMLRANGCSNEVVDSIWRTSTFLRTYEKNLKSINNTP